MTADSNKEVWNKLSDAQRDRISSVLDAILDQEEPPSPKDVRSSLLEKLNLEVVVSEEDIAIRLAQTKGSYQALQYLAASYVTQQERASKAFHLIAGDKGIIVQEDLLESAHILEMDLSPQEAEEMMDEFGNDGLVARPEFFTIVNLVNL